ncbi:hypothetical protein ABH930_006385 [Kitasatospora sp. GAS204A]|uniref:DUF6197 family protein n=1 Tax=unclassified Kitasatospora TaxID=2633591 RepID=UPI0024743DA4|nr:hypothetical protein [Kitasatospora sp. GAS204B]MDH6122023.1 hypothetical protein [Kitasatospora sp. GAS204B]
MPTLLTAPPAFDLDAAGLRLVAEVEQYLASLPAPASVRAGRVLDLIRHQAPPVVPQYGSVVQPWHAGIERPAPRLLDRLHRRQPVAQVTVRQHLELTSRYIHQHGWLQGALWNEAGAVCILGAQLRVLAAGYGTAATITEARLQIGNQLGRQGQGMPTDTWNDQPGRRATDIHQLLQRAAARTH